MNFTLSAADAERVAEALRRLTAIKTELSFDVRAYGSINVDIRDPAGEYMRLEWDTERQQYVLEEPFR